MGSTLDNHFDAKWHNTTKTHWVRANMGVERFMAVLAEYEAPEAGMLTVTLTELAQPLEKEVISPRLRAAWRACYYQIPTLTYQIVRIHGKKNSFEVHYEQSTTAQEAAEWTDRTFTESSSPADVDQSKAMAAQIPAASSIRLPQDAGSQGILQVHYFEQQGKVTHIGFLACISHCVSDGTGTYLMMNCFFTNAANELAVEDEKMKCKPELSVMDTFDPKLWNEDHTANVNELLRAFAAPAISHKVQREYALPDRVPSTSIARCLFSKEETAQLLLRAKELKVTISQLAQAAMLVPIFKQFPASEAAALPYTAAINMRNLITLPTPFYGNAVCGYFDYWSCVGFSKAVLKGILDKDEVEAAQVLYREAKTLTQLVKSHLLDPTVKMISVNKTVDMICDAFDPNTGPLPFPTPIMADGLLERHMNQKYRGSGLSVDVQDAYLTIQNIQPLIHGRTSTFQGQLSLLMSYDLRSWSDEEVEQMAQEWGHALRFILQHARPE